MHQSPAMNRWANLTRPCGSKIALVLLYWTPNRIYFRSSSDHYSLLSSFKVIPHAFCQRRIPGLRTQSHTAIQPLARKRPKNHACFSGRWRSVSNGIHSRTLKPARLVAFRNSPCVKVCKNNCPMPWNGKNLSPHCTSPWRSFCHAC